MPIPPFVGFGLGLGLFEPDGVLSCEFAGSFA